MAEKDKELIENIEKQEYKYGFTSDIETETIPRGLNEEVVRLISTKKGEPEWMTERRLKAYRHWLNMVSPSWAHLTIPPIDFQDVIYYAAPKPSKKLASMDEVDPELKRTFDKLGIPLEEQMALAGVAVDAVMDSVSVKTTFKETLAEKGIIFCSMSEAIRDYPELIQKYLGSVVPYTDNFYAALNAAVFSDGSFCYIPKGVRCPMELSTYFRINAAGTGQFERTLIVADRDATLGQLAYRDLVYVSPDEDQEDVTDEMTKYDLVAIPVCDENRHILGIVTFDDAMDVIAEEHQEDLQIAGVGSGDSASDDSTNVLSWFVHRQYWVVVWGIASCIMATVLGTALGSAYLVVFPMCAMPLVLLAASRMVSFVKNYFLEYDGHDDEPKPYLGFFFQSTGMGLILSLVTYLCAQLVRTAAFPDATMFEEQLFTGCFNIAAIICLVGNMSAVIYLMVLFWRDEHDLNTSGTAMNVIAVMISCVAYCVAAVLLTMSVMG